MVTATVVGAMGFAVGMQQRQQKKLNAAEVANRLMLIFMDDPTELDKMGPLVAYDGAKYRWTKQEGGVTVHSIKPPPAAGAPGSGNSAGGSNQTLDRLINVTISTWLSEESGGSVAPEPLTPAATLVRVVDPLPLRNPDSLSNMVTDENLRKILLEKFLGRGGTRTTTTGAGTAGGTVGSAPKSGNSSSKSGGNSAAPRTPAPSAKPVSPATGKSTDKGSGK